MAALARRREADDGEMEVDESTAFGSLLPGELGVSVLRVSEEGTLPVALVLSFVLLPSMSYRIFRAQPFTLTPGRPSAWLAVCPPQADTPRLAAA